MTTPHTPDDDLITSDPGTSDADSRRGIPRWITWSIVAVVAIVAVGYGLILLYAKVLNDSPDEFGESDLDAALASPPTVTVTRPAAPSGGEAWTVARESELGYRVKEILFGVDTEGVGRTNEITGSMTIDGTTVTTAEFTVDVASITSDDGRRDNQFRGRIMTTSEFPTATFVLTEPIELGVEPADGAEVTTSATGELTLRGVTNTVTFDLTARQEGDRIGVLGDIPIVFADYAIANPSNPGVTTEDHGLLEFVLVFEPA